MAAGDEGEDDVPALSAETFSALQDFYKEQVRVELRHFVTSTNHLSSENKGQTRPISKHYKLLMYTKTQLLFGSQQQLGNNLNGHPVVML